MRHIPVLFLIAVLLGLCVPLEVSAIPAGLSDPSATRSPAPAPARVAKPEAAETPLAWKWETTDCSNCWLPLGGQQWSLERCCSGRFTPVSHPEDNLSAMEAEVAAEMEGIATARMEAAEELAAALEREEAAQAANLTPVVEPEPEIVLEPAPVPVALERPAPAKAKEVVPQAVSAPKTHKVGKGETLSKIARGYPGVSWQEICQANRLSNCDRLKVGQVLEIPPKGVAPAAAPATKTAKTKGQPKVEARSQTSAPARKPVRPAPVVRQAAGPTSIEAVIAKAKAQAPATALADPVPGSETRMREWKNVGVAPVVDRKQWHSRETLSLTALQRRRLAEAGLGAEQIAQVDNDLRGRRCHATERPEGHVWSFMGFGKGLWGQTRNSTGESRPVWACPATGDVQVDVPMDCGNVAS